jgi:hypothetical protein
MTRAGRLHLHRRSLDGLPDAEGWPAVGEKDRMPGRVSRITGSSMRRADTFPCVLTGMEHRLWCARSSGI